MLTALINLHGFAIIDDLLSRSEIDPLLEALPDIEKNGRAGVRHLLKNPAVRALAESRQLYKISKEVLGLDAFPFKATLFAKSQTTNWLVTWHQDKTLPLREKREAIGWGPWSIKDGTLFAHAPATELHKILALRVHLDNSTESNGPLLVLPGSHTRGILHDGEIKDLAATCKPVECVVKRGGVLAMSPLLVHSSSKIKGTESRRVLHIEYAVSANLENNLELAIV
jgi:ectoine hydroxylase-related dioxygenase (phytanoyl-CoA dioxygenase family)